MTWEVLIILPKLAYCAAVGGDLHTPFLQRFKFTFLPKPKTCEDMRNPEKQSLNFKSVGYLAGSVLRACKS